MDLDNKIKHFKILTPTPGFGDWLAQSDTEPDPTTSTRKGMSPLQARLVFSWLAYRARLGLGASTRAICREVGLHPATVATALNSLGTLVSRRGDEWVADEPPDGLFVPRRCEEQVKHWGDRLAYLMLYLPRRGAKIQYKEISRRFGLSHAIVCSYLFRKGKTEPVRGFTFAGAAKLFGLDPKTVASIINDLLWEKMIEVEDLGRSCDITVLTLTDEHLALFEPKPKPERKKVEPVEQKPRPAPVPYKNTGGQWDVCRKLCEGLMPQRTAEAAIKKAQRLGDTQDDFENQFLQAKGFHDQNILTGKVAKGNFGKYLNACFDSRIAKLEEQEKVEKAERRLEEYLRSDDYKAKLDAAKANPLDRLHFVGTDSILDRIRFHENLALNWRGAHEVERLVHRHVLTFVRTKRLLIQEETDLSGNLAGRILKTALAAVNHYYNKPTRATREEFEEALNAAIRKVEPQMKLLFNKEVANAN